MKLSKIGYLALRDRDLKRKVADEMGVTENTIYRWIKIQSDDLTKAGVLEVIAKETGLHVEQLVTKIQPVAA